MDQRDLHCRVMHRPMIGMEESQRNEQGMGPDGADKAVNGALQVTGLMSGLILPVAKIEPDRRGAEQREGCQIFGPPRSHDIVMRAEAGRGVPLGDGVACSRPSRAHRRDHGAGVRFQDATAGQHGVVAMRGEKQQMTKRAGDHKDSVTSDTHE